jgi:LTXXQ motif family protein
LAFGTSPDEDTMVMRKKVMRKNIARKNILMSTAALGLSLCLATTAATARPGGGGGGAHVGGGGGGAHFGGGGGGAHFGGGGGPHFGGGGAPHFSAGAVHAAPHFTAHAAPHFSGRANFAAHTSHLNRSNFHAAGHGLNAPAINHAAISHAVTPGSVHPAVAGAHLAHAGLGVSAAAFAAHRTFASAGAFHSFSGAGWHWHHHLGWIGPLFWPYAYGDFFYYALWPDDYAYYDPFWIYGYPDIYEGIFSPYDYSDYVRGSGAPARMATLTQNMAQSCDDEAAEVTGWPIDQIAAAVQPSQEQTALLDDLGNAVVKASSVVKSNCPTTVSFTPTGRLDAMQQRLQGLVQAVNIVSTPLDKFYDSLSDEQKARFNNIKPPADKEAAPNAQADNAAANNPKSQCDAQAMAWPTEQIDRVVQPTDAQRAKLEALQTAVANGADTIKAACPSEPPSTPPARLAAIGKHLQAMLQAVDTIRPPLHDFYNSLSDDQKARFNTMGKQLFAQNQ